MTRRRSSSVAPATPFHAGKALVEQLTAEQILDDPARCASIRQPLLWPAGSCVQLQLGEAGVVVPARGPGFLAFGQHGLVEQLRDLLQVPSKLLRRNARGGCRRGSFAI